MSNLYKIIMISGTILAVFSFIFQTFLVSDLSRRMDISDFLGDNLPSQNNDQKWRVRDTRNLRDLDDSPENQKIIEDSENLTNDIDRPKEKEPDETEEPIEDNGKVITDSIELEKRLRSISFKQFGGRWSIKDQKDREKISTHLNNINGVVKTKIEYHKDSSTFPSLRIENTMHDGEYRDQVIYQKVSFNETIFVKHENKILISHKNANVEISYGRLYSIAQDHNCKADVNATFEVINSQNIKGTILLTSDGSCFPEEMLLEVEFPNQYAISKRRVFNYVIILTCLLIGYCYVTNRQ
mmetsp:Transcript_7213/g.8145  ORF Transcript_7213/g.8145 Transcript_7213/m.8145 type:complete len:297 (-) Transcript_7213:970-1860(-)